MIVGPALPPVISMIFLEGDETIGIALAWTLAGLGILGAVCLGRAIHGYRLASSDLNDAEIALQLALAGE